MTRTDTNVAPTVGLELWPALLAELWPERPDDCCDDFLTAKLRANPRGPALVTLTFNPSIDVDSRERFTWLLARSVHLWDVLRKAVGTLEAAQRDATYDEAIRLLSEVAGFVALDVGTRGAARDAARRNVNEDTLYRLDRLEQARRKGADHG